MKRIHYLLLGLLVSLTIAAVSPDLPPTRIAPGANTTVVTNGINSFTISSSAGGSAAQLNGTNVFTGTNTFPAAGFFPANNIGLRLLYSSPTNYFLTTTAVSAVKLTNNGDYITGTPLWSVTVPALLGVRSRVMYELLPERTNAVSSGAFLYAFYVGANTNYIYDSGYGNVGVARSAAQQSQGYVMFENDLSMTNQINLGSSTFMYSSNLVDTSIPWLLYVNCWATTTASTNILFRGLRVWEYVTY